MPPAPTQPASPTAYGYPVMSAKDLGLDDYFKSRPDVAGMAWGGGENGSDPSEPRSVVHNPYNEHMGDPKRRDALYKVEASRHLMASKPVPKFKISPELQGWRERAFKPGDPYRENDDNFRGTVISRMLVGDTGEQGDMPFEDETNKITSEYAAALSGTQKAEGGYPLRRSPLTEAWMQSKAAQQQQQQADLAMSARAKESLAAVLSAPKLGGRSPLRFNGGRPFAP